MTLGLKKQNKTKSQHIKRIYVGVSPQKNSKVNIYQCFMVFKESN